MFRRALVLCLAVVGFLSLVIDAEACHRCRHRRGHGYSGCGTGCGSYRPQRVAKVYRTVRVPVQTCTMTCVVSCDPCGNLVYTATPTYTTTYVTKKILVHTQVVGSGPVYGNYLDGTRRQVAGGYGAARTPYRGGYAAPYGQGLGGGYRLGGYGAADEADLDESNIYEARYQTIEAEKTESTQRVGLAF